MKKNSIITILIVILILAVGFDIFLRLRGNGVINVGNSTKEIPIIVENPIGTEVITTGNTIIDTGNQIEEPTSIQEPEENLKLRILTSIDDDVVKNSMWCGTFQLVRNDMVNNIVKQDVIFDPQLEIVENLNKQTFSDKYLSDNSYYAKFGLLTLDLKDEIEVGIKEKFDETSDILDQLDWSNVPQSDDAYDGKDEKKYGFYAMLKKIFNFETAFDELSNGKFDNKYDDIEYFGIDGNSNELLYKQVYIYYYNSDDDFAVALKTKEGEDIILARGIEGRSFMNIYSNILKNEFAYTGKRYFTENDYLKVPNLQAKSLVEFEKLENNYFFTIEGNICSIEKALQAIEFELNKSGGYIKSEAFIGMMETTSISEPVKIEHRYFYFDKPFVMFRKESDKSLPYFAAQISDITLFQ